MEPIIDLLSEKNFCLQRYRQLTQGALDMFRHGDFDQLEDFYKTRSELLGLIQNLSRTVQTFDQTTPLNDDEKLSLKRLLAQRSELIHEIMDLDLSVISVIEDAKASIIKDLTQTKAVRKASGFLDQRGLQIDEEA